ncbi:Uncharacterised protein [uncultured archaeon]|nr:Uncharacterised protein [uncultured archaeon]
MKAKVENDLEGRRAQTRGMMRNALDELGVLPLTGKILEVGAGNGEFNRIIGLDSVQFDSDKRALKANPAKNKVRGDIFSLSRHFREAEFDWAISYCFLYQFTGPELENILGQISKVLGKEGRLLIASDHHPALRPYVRELVDAGFFPLPHALLGTREVAGRPVFARSESFYCLSQEDFRMIMEWQQGEMLMGVARMAAHFGRFVSPEELAPFIFAHGAIRGAMDRFGFQIRSSDIKEFCDWAYGMLIGGEAIGTDMPKYFALLMDLHQQRTKQQLQRADLAQKFQERLGLAITAAGMRTEKCISRFEIEGAGATPIYAAVAAKSGI